MSSCRTCHPEQHGAATAPPADLDASQEQERRQAVDKMFQNFKTKAFPKAPDVTVKELEEWLNDTGKNVVVVDVRTPGEQEVSMIPGAIRRKEFEKHTDRYKDHTVVAYCTIGYRSGQYVQELRGRNLNAFNLKGSILEWSLDGLPLVTGTEASSAGGKKAASQTKRVHVFGETWNLVGKGYEAVWYVRLPWHRLLLDFVMAWVRRIRQFNFRFF